MTIAIRLSRLHPLTLFGVGQPAVLSLTFGLLVVVANGSAFAQTKVQDSPASVGASPGSSSAPGAHERKVGTSEGGKASEAGGVAAARVKLLADTRKLIALSRELQAERVKSTPETLSLNMVKKAEEIEKLAAVVRAEIAKLQ